MRLKNLLPKILQLLAEKPKAHRLAYVGLGLLMLFVVANVAVLLMYRNQTFPNLVVNGTKLGNRNRAELGQALRQDVFLPGDVTLTAHGKKLILKTADLGISLNEAQTIDNLLAQRGWLPIVNLWTRHHGQVVLTVNQAKLDSRAKILAATFSQPAVDASAVFKDGTYKIASPHDGYSLDWPKSRAAILGGLRNANHTVSLMTVITKPKITAQQLEPAAKSLQQTQTTAIALTYNGQTMSASASQIGSWYQLTGTTFSLNEAAVRHFIATAGSGWGIQVQNIDAAWAAIRDSLRAHKPLHFAVIAAPKPHKTFTYCVAAKGVNASYLPDLRAKLRSTYNDNRGWNLGGQVSFTEVTSGCNFTVWLSAASVMPLFGAICDSIWSCTVSPNVIINFDRWTGASPAWNAAGGSLDNYRSMVINHETGHWLGFDHRYCSGPGQPAPVMQQQSISLQGCTFNPWPTAAELATLRLSLGL